MPRLIDTTGKTLLYAFLPFGMFVFLTGKILLPGSSSHIAQTYIWLMLPTLIFCLVCGKKFFHGYRISLLDISIGGFLVLNMLSFFWSSTDHEFGRYYKDALYITLFLFAISALVRSSRLNLGLVFEFSSIVVAIGAGLSLYYHFVLNDFTIQFRQHRIYNMGPWEFGNFNNPIPAALFFAPFAIILFLRFLEARQQPVRQALLLVGMVTIQSYVVMTGSRGPIFAMLTGYLALIVLRKSRSSLSLGATLFSLILILGTSNGMFKINLMPLQSAAQMPVSGLIPATAGASFREKPSVEKFENYLDEKFSYRGTIWLGTIEKSIEAPWFGHGINARIAIPYYNNRHTALHAHNLYIQIFYETGVAGLSLFLLMTVLALKLCWQHRLNPTAQMATGLFVFGLLGFLADVHKIFNKPDTFWILYWLPMGMIIGVQMKETIGSISFASETEKARVIKTLAISTKAPEKSKANELEV